MIIYWIYIYCKYTLIVDWSHSYIIKHGSATCVSYCVTVHQTGIFIATFVNKLATYSHKVDCKVAWMNLRRHFKNYMAQYWHQKSDVEFPSRRQPIRLGILVRGEVEVDR